MDEKLIEEIELELCRLKDDEENRKAYIKNLIEKYYECGYFDAFKMMNTLFNEMTADATIEDKDTSKMS